MESRSTSHIGVVALRQIENAGDIFACSERLRAVKRHHQGDGNAFAAKIGRHFHDGIGTERVTDQDDRPFFSGLKIDGRPIGERLPLAIAVHSRIDTTPVELLRQRVHTERKDIHQAAQQINMRARLRRARIGSEHEHRSNDHDSNRSRSPRTPHDPLTSLLFRHAAPDLNQACSAVQAILIALRICSKNAT
jgi:hypothetical protein